jgi:hypothetical protein
MEEYIYILIGVIWLAASIYKASQKSKKKASQQKPSSVPEEQGTKVPEVRSFLEELLGGQEVRIPDPEESEVSYEESAIAEIEKEKPAGSFQAEYSNYGFRGLKALSGEGVSSLGSITFKDEMKELTKKGPGQNKINLRKAIIYSAILERPYS